LHCAVNYFSSLNVSACTALTYLNCYYNPISSLNVSSCTALITLDCRANQLANLNVSANSALTSLRCSSNQLESLNVSACTALSTLDCSDNSLTNLNVSDNTALTGLGCSTNYLSSLNVSANKALTSLYCNGNQLTNLYVKNGKNQQMYFDATDNPNLTCIEVDDSARSSVYWRDKKDATAFFSEHCSVTGINTIAQSKSTQFYPNPTTGSIFLTEKGNITLSDLSGKQLLEQKNTNQLDISALPAGMYFLRVGDNLKQIFKIIKE
jgi:Leucine-rich repeat (LRR) protein